MTRRSPLARPGPWAMLFLVSLAGLPQAASTASPPPPSEPDPGLVSAPPPLDPAADLAPPPPDRFWLSVELIGPRGAQLDAASSLLGPPLSDALPRGGSPPPGEYVGEAQSLADTLHWIDRHAFTEAVAGELETPGGALLRAHEVVLTALVATRVGPPASPYPWPPANVLAVPEALGWRPATPSVARVPLFALPDPQPLPARERYRELRANDSVWVLAERDVCSPAGHCASWTKTLVRRGDRFFGGWVPSPHVVPDDAWIGGPQERRFALRRGHRDTRSCSFALIEQRGERREAPVGIYREHIGPEWPDAAIEVLGEQLIVVVNRDTALSRHIDTTPSPVLTP